MTTTTSDADCDAQQGESTSDYRFLEEARRMLESLSEACASLVRAAPGGIRTAADLERALGVNKKIAWQVFKLAETKGSLSVGSFLPGADPVRRLIDAAQQKQLPTEVVQDLENAFGAFDNFVRTHAGDRASFISMLGSSREESDTDRLHARAAFRAASHFLGAQAAVRTNIFMAWTNGKTNDFVSLRGRLGLRRLRADATVVVDRHMSTRAPEEMTHILPQPLDTAAAQRSGAVILPSFCSKPLPGLRSVEEPNGYRRIELTENMVGLQGAVDLMFGTVTRGVAHQVSTADAEHGVHSMVTNDVPTALLVQDVLMHTAYGDVQPTLTAYADPLAAESAEYRARATLLPVRYKVDHLGRGPSGATTSDFPRYAELIGYTCALMGWDPDEFNVYRVRIEFPLLHSVIRIAFRLS